MFPGLREARAREAERQTPLLGRFRKRRREDENDDAS